VDGTDVGWEETHHAVCGQMPPHEPGIYTQDTQRNDLIKQHTYATSPPMLIFFNIDLDDVALRCQMVNRQRALGPQSAGGPGVGSTLLNVRSPSVEGFSVKI
jgi:hypothetical protein